MSVVINSSDVEKLYGVFLEWYLFLVVHAINREELSYGHPTR